MEIVVSPDGVETNAGTADSPWPLKKGLNQLAKPGDVLSLREGTYVGTAILTEKIGTPDNPIVIRSFPGEHAVLDGASHEEFAVAPNNSVQWFDARGLISCSLGSAASILRSLVLIAFVNGLKLPRR